MMNAKTDVLKDMGSARGPRCTRLRRSQALYPRMFARCRFRRPVS